MVHRKRIEPFYLLIARSLRSFYYDIREGRHSISEASSNCRYNVVLLFLCFSLFKLGLEPPELLAPRFLSYLVYTDP